MSGFKVDIRPPRDAVTALLDGASLPSSDVDDELLKHFIAVWSGGEIAGIVGLEPFGVDGLLRSLVVKDSKRGKGLGHVLVAEMETHAASLGIGSLYLLTTTAAQYFQRLGYRDCLRAEAPGSIRNSGEFSALCPDDAAFMCKRLGTA